CSVKWAAWPDLSRSMCPRPSPDGLLRQACRSIARAPGFRAALSLFAKPPQITYNRPQGAMHVNVRDILAESVGYSRAYKITGERPELEQARLTRDVEGEITISRLELGLLVKGRLSTEIELVCDRCLRTFARPTTVKFQQLFSEIPGDDEMPI